MLLQLISIEVLRMDEFNADSVDLDEDDEQPDPFDYYETLLGPFGNPYDQRKPLADMIPAYTLLPFHFDASCSFDIRVLDVPRERTVVIHVLDTIFENRRHDRWDDDYGMILTNHVPKTLRDVAILVQKYRKNIAALDVS